MSCWSRTTSGEPSNPHATCPPTTTLLVRPKGETQKMRAKVSHRLLSLMLLMIGIACVLKHLVCLSTLVTSIWHYSRENALSRQDKDFKKLNKSALGNRATTAHQQYLHRQQSDIRIRHPSQVRDSVQRKAQRTCGGSMSAMRYGGTGRQNQKKLAPPMIIPSDQNENFTYGAALRPSTPIKAVIGNFYGEIASFEH